MQYLVAGVCDNQIEYLYQFDDQDKAIARAIEIGNELYNEDSVNKFIKRNNLEEEHMRVVYDRYFRSEEYFDQNDNGSIEIVGIE